MDRRSITSDSDTTRSNSAWGPLAWPVFRALWLAALASNIGSLMQGVAASVLMTTLTSSPLPVALLTTMANLPLFLVGLPAGALADLVDRRWLVLVTQVWMLVAAALLSALTFMGWMTPWMLLAFTFMISLGGALSAPAWQTIIPALVPRRQLANAVALNSAGFNLARAIGPAIGGLLVAAAGAAIVFSLNSASFLAVIAVIYWWKPAPQELPQMPERVGSAVAAGVRYARHSPPLRAVLVRTAAFIFAACAMLALLPVIATNQLGLGATGYGIMLASIGIGAVGGATLLPRLRERFSIDQLSVVLTLIFAIGLCIVALAQHVVVVNIALVFMGVGWLAINSFFNVSAQTSAPAWVQARALGIYLLVSQGGLSVGSAVWGVVADRYGEQTAMLAAAVVLVLGLATVRYWPLIGDDNSDLTPASYWKLPRFAQQPEPEAGPVMVTIEYRVLPSQREEFQLAMQAVQVMRLRDGAIYWELFHDTAEPERFLETFTLRNWAEHIRQNDRATVADKLIEQRALACQKPGTRPIVSRFIATRNRHAEPATGDHR